MGRVADEVIAHAPVRSWNALPPAAAPSPRHHPSNAMRLCRTEHGRVVSIATGCVAWLSVGALRVARKPKLLQHQRLAERTRALHLVVKVLE
jgi:hypothetical protein